MVLESDDASTNCNYGSGATWCSPEIKSTSIAPIHYDSSAPAIYNNTGVSFVALNTFTETLGSACAGVVKYTLSKDKTTWYYWTGVTWAAADGTYTQANTSAQLTPAILGNFGTQLGTGNIYFKAFLNSSGITACELSDVTIGGDQ